MLHALVHDDMLRELCVFCIFECRQQPRELLPPRSVGGPGQYETATAAYIETLIKSLPPTSLEDPMSSSIFCCPIPDALPTFAVLNGVSVVVVLVFQVQVLQIHDL